MKPRRAGRHSVIVRARECVLGRRASCAVVAAGFLALLLAPASVQSLSLRETSTGSTTTPWRFASSTIVAAE